MAAPDALMASTAASSAVIPPESRRDFAGLLPVVAFAGDAVAIVAGLLIAFWVRFHSGWITFGVQAAEIPGLRVYLPLFAVGTAFLLGAFIYMNVYDHRHLLRFRRVTLLIAKAIMLWFVLYLGVSLALKFQPPISRIYAASSAISCGLTVLTWRQLFHWFAQRESMAARLRQKVVFVGWTMEATRLYEAIQGDPVHPYQVVGCVPSAEGRLGSNPPPDVKRLGTYDSLPELLRHRIADLLIVADVDPSTGNLLSLANLCEKEFVHYKVIPSYFQILISGLQLETVSGVPILGISRLPLDRLINRFLKRSVDLVGAVVGLVLFAPIIALFGALVYWESPGSILFRQVRMGRNGQLFNILKIRSMRLDAEAGTGAQWATRDDPRRLRIGRFMRSYNIDELPQFWNVLMGEMSLVGPRPERPELIANFKHLVPHYNARHSSKPGLTGWAQVHGLRGNTDLAERIRYDIYYLENWSPLLDFQIMIMTFLSRKNAY